MQYIRTQVYEKKREPKEAFKVIGAMIEKHLKDRDRESLQVLDIGCASGDFIDYISGRLGAGSYYGVDVDEKLLALARKSLPKASFSNADACDLSAFADNSFDIVSYLGTMTIFDDFRPSLGEAIRVLKPKGMLVVFTFFNEHPVDLTVRWKYSESEDAWNSGYNLFSMKSVNAYLDAHDKVTGHEFQRFEMPFDLPPQEDPIRSWTEKDASGRRVFVNAVGHLNMQILNIVT